MKLTKYGTKEWLGSGIIALLAIIVFLLLGFMTKLFIVCNILIVLALVCWIGVALFFRDPKRKIVEEEGALIAPADGVVKDIEIIKDFPQNDLFKGREAMKVGIFLSVLNVHLNRAPCDIEVLDILYKKGKFLDARDERATKENESNTLVCKAKLTEEAKDIPMLVRQISGAIADKVRAGLTRIARIKKDGKR